MVCRKLEQTEHVISIKTFKIILVTSVFRGLDFFVIPNEFKFF